MNRPARRAAAALAVSLVLLVAGCGDDDDGAAAGDSGADGGRDGSVASADASSATTLRIHYPAGAETITVRGQALPGGWTAATPTVAGAADTWTFTTTTLTAATEWKPLLGDTWSLGANYHVEPGQTLDVYPHFRVTAGQVMQFASPFASTSLGNSRTVWAYLPPSYLENPTVRLPVAYMHDGQNLFMPGQFGDWRVDETLNAAAAGGRCVSDQRACQSDGDCGGARCDSFRETIVIAPENAGSARIYEYTPTPDPSYPDGGGADRYLDFLVGELKPRVDAMLRTLTGAEDTAILGSSLGGLLSAHAGLVRPAVFGLNGVMSPSTWWDRRLIIARVMAFTGTPRPLRVYVDSGDSGNSNDDVDNTRALAAAYQGIGYVSGQNFVHLVAPGHEHTEYYWAQRLPGALSFLLGPRERLAR